MNQLKAPRIIYFYNNLVQLLEVYPSANEAAQKSGIPKSTLLHYCDKKKVNESNKTVRRVRTFSPIHNDLVIISSIELVKIR